MATSPSDSDSEAGGETEKGKFAARELSETEQLQILEAKEEEERGQRAVIRAAPA